MDSLKRYLTACCPCFGLAEPVSVESVCLQVGGRSFDLNEASQADLESLPGIGPSKAAAIVLHREKHGRFLCVDGLLAVSGIGAATVAKVRGLVRSSADARAPDRPTVPPPPPPNVPAVKRVIMGHFFLTAHSRRPHRAAARAGGRAGDARRGDVAISLGHSLRDARTRRARARAE